MAEKQNPFGGSVNFRLIEEDPEWPSLPPDQRAKVRQDWVRTHMERFKTRDPEVYKYLTKEAFQNQTPDETANYVSRGVGLAGRLWDAPAEYVHHALQQRSDLPWYDPRDVPKNVAEPIKKTWEYIKGEQNPETDLPWYENPLNFQGGYGAVKGLGKMAAKRMPTLMKAGRMAAEKLPWKKAAADLPQEVEAAATPMRQAGEFIRPTGPPPAATVGQVRPLQPPPSGLYRQARQSLQRHFIPEEARTVADFAARNPSDPISKAILENDAESVVGEINRRIFGRQVSNDAVAGTELPTQLQAGERNFARRMKAPSSPREMPQMMGEPMPVQQEQVLGGNLKPQPAAATVPPPEQVGGADINDPVKYGEELLNFVNATGKMAKKGVKKVLGQ